MEGNEYIFGLDNNNSQGEIAFEDLPSFDNYENGDLFDDLYVPNDVGDNFPVTEAELKKQRTENLFDDENLFSLEFGKCDDSIFPEKGTDFPIPTRLDVPFDDDVKKKLLALGCENLEIASCMLRSYIFFLSPGSIKQIRKGTRSPGVLIWDPLLLLSEALCEERTNVPSMIRRLFRMKEKGLLLFLYPNTPCTYLGGYPKCNYNEQYSIRTSSKEEWIKLSSFSEEQKSNFKTNSRIKNFINENSIANEDEKINNFIIDKDEIVFKEDIKYDLFQFMFAKVKEIIESLNNNDSQKKAYKERLKSIGTFDCSKTFCPKEFKIIEQTIINYLEKNMNLNSKEAKNLLDDLKFNEDLGSIFNRSLFLPLFKNELRNDKFKQNIKNFLGLNFDIDPKDTGTLDVKAIEELSKEYRKAKTTEEPVKKKSKPIATKTVPSIRTPPPIITEERAKITRDLDIREKVYTAIKCEKTNGEAKITFEKKITDCVDTVEITAFSSENIDLCGQIYELIATVDRNKGGEIQILPDNSQVFWKSQKFQDSYEFVEDDSDTNKGGWNEVQIQKKVEPKVKFNVRQKESVCKVQ